jgi:hypothetical protein
MTSGGIAPPFLISTQDQGEWSTSSPGRFNPQGNRLRYPLGRSPGRIQSRSGHSGKRKNLPLPGTEPRLSSP